MNVHVVPYEPSRKEEWDTFVARSVNATFLHFRDYMDYHAHRFDDFSLMIYRGHKLIGLVPAHRKGNTLKSHYGLTYGGWIWAENFKMEEILEIWEKVLAFVAASGFENFYLKEIPLFFYSYGTEKNRLAYREYGEPEHEMIFWLIDTRKPVDKLLNRNRRRSLNKAISHSVAVKESDQWDIFWSILEKNLSFRHDASPVHSLDEIRLLAGKFPQNIKLYLAFLNKEPVAGTVIYLKKKVFHFQYLSVLPEPSGIRFMADYLVWTLINHAYEDFDFISLGTAEKDGRPDPALTYWKYSFGCEPFSQYFWKFDLKNKHNKR